MEIPSITAEEVVRSVSFKVLQIGIDFSARELTEQAALSCEELKSRHELGTRKVALSEIRAGVSCRPLHVTQNVGFDKLVASLEEQGWNSAYLMILQQLDQGYRVIEGNHRWVALKLLQSRGCKQDKWTIHALILGPKTPMAALFRIGNDANASVESYTATPFVQLFKNIDYFQRAEATSGPLSNAPATAQTLGYSTRWKSSYFREIFQNVRRLSTSVKDQLYRLASEKPVCFGGPLTQAVLMHRKFAALGSLFQQCALQQLTTAAPNLSATQLITSLTQRSVLYEYVSGKSEQIVSLDKKTALLKDIYDGGCDKLKSKYPRATGFLQLEMDRRMCPLDDKEKTPRNTPIPWVTLIHGTVGTASLKQRLEPWHGRVALALFDPPFGLSQSKNSHDVIDKVVMHATASLLDALLDKDDGMMIFSHNFDHRTQWKDVMELHGFKVSRVPFFAQETPVNKLPFHHDLFQSTVTQWMIAGRSLKGKHLAQEFQPTPFCMYNFHSFSRPAYHERVHDVQKGSVLRNEQKGIEHLLFFLARFAEPGALILDPFMGTGSTGAAALQHGCHFVGVDADERCVRLAQNRLDREEATQAMRELKNGDSVKRRRLHK